MKNKDEVLRLIQNTFTGFTCGIRPHADVCDGCQYETSEDGLKVECSQALEFADILYAKLPKRGWKTTTLGKPINKEAV